MPTAAESMRPRRFLLEILAMSLISSAATAAPVAGADRKAIVAAAKAPAETALKRRVWFHEKTLTVEKDWAFLIAEMQESGGQPIDYQGTPKAAQAEAGFLSKDYVALLQRKDGAWAVVAEAVGPTDVVWADWPSRYGAPESLFKG